MPTTDLCNHWTDRPEWYQDRQLWAFYITFPGQPELHERVARDQDVLAALPEFDLIRRANLHLSVQGVAFVDEVGASHIQDLADAVRIRVRTERLPSLTVGRAQLDYDAISLPVTPVDELARLKCLIKDEADRVLAGQAVYQLPESPGGFSPHISIAYANDDISARTIAPFLPRLESEPLRIDVQEISLVKLKRQERKWFWADEQSFELGQPARVRTGAR